MPLVYFKHAWLGSLVLVGCAAGVAVTPAMIKDDMAKFVQDDRECIVAARREAATFAAHAGWWARRTNTDDVERQSYQDCMIAKGYRRAARS
jgi:hypothetical protein